MTKIILKLRVVTPLFIAGAEQERQAELREPSIKGLLRFWYRAIYADDPVGEARIFGGQGKGQGQSKILLRITEREGLLHGAKNDGRWDGQKTAYLGYGVISRQETGKVITDKQGNNKKEKKDITTRPYIKSRSRFVLTILFKPHSKDGSKENSQIFQEDELRVKMALWAWVMFGGLGARTRNGFGSLVVESATGMEDDGLPALKVKDKEELQKSIQAFIKMIPALPKISGYPDYTQWSKETRCSICSVTGQGTNGEDALEKLGNKIHKLRSYKSTGKLAWVTDDRNLMDKFVRNVNTPTRPPLRSAFGLPHSYFFSSSGKSGEVNVMDENDKKGRRGSPLFFSVYEFSTSTQACIVALYLPAKLIPADKKIRLTTGEKGEKGYLCKDIKLPDDFTAVTDILDELSKDGLKVYP